LAGFEWLKRGCNVGAGNSRAVFGGSALWMLACLLPTLMQLPLQFEGLRAGAQLTPRLLTLIWAASGLVGLLLIPVTVGYLRVIDASERGLPARARDIFQPYLRGEALRLIGYGLAMLALDVAVFGAVLVAMGGGVFRWYQQLAIAQANHQAPVVALPSGFGATVVLLAVTGLFLLGVRAVALGQIALGRRSVFQAIGDGLSGAVKNVLPLVVFAFSLVVALLIFAILIILLAGLLTLVGKLVGTWLVLLLVIPLYIAVMVGLGAALSGMMYYLWRDVCGGGDDHASAVAQSIAA
jgi:hypothetical protein